MIQNVTKCDLIRKERDNNGHKTPGGNRLRNCISGRNHRCTGNEEGRSGQSLVPAICNSGLHTAYIVCNSVRIFGKWVVQIKQRIRYAKKVVVDKYGADEAMKKVKKLNRLLKEANALRDELAKNEVVIKLTVTDGE